MFLPLPRGRCDAPTQTSGFVLAVAGGAVVVVPVATAVDVAVAVAVAVATVAVSVAVGVAVAVPVAVAVGSGGGGGGLFFCVPHATSIAGESIAALITERTTSLIGDLP